MWPEKQRNGKLRYVERYKDPYTGKMKRAYEQIEKDTPQGRKKAAVALQLKINELLNAKPERDTVTFGTVFSEYMQSWRMGVKETTVISSRHINVRIHEAIPNDYLISKIDRRYLQKIFDDLLANGYSHNYVKKIKGRLNQTFKYAVRMNYIDSNEMSFVEIPKEVLTPEKVQKKKTKFLDKSEVKILIQEISKDIKHNKYAKKYYRIAVILFMTGMRYGELAGLDPRTDINFENSKIHVQYTYDFKTNKRTTPKTKKSDRIFDVPKIALTLIQEQILENIKDGLGTDYLFFNSKGKVLSTSRIITVLKEYGQKAGLEKNITTHIFRHSHISLLAELGIPLPAIMERVGHSDSKTTLEIYSHVTMQMTLDLSNRLNALNLF